MRMPNSTRLLVSGAVLSVVLVAGCGSAGFSGLYNTSLPGGADIGDHPYRVSAQFSDVLDLVPQASVKVNDVAIGRVERIELAPDTKSATVRMIVNGDVELPVNANAELRQSSLLGEKFVELRPPSDVPPGGRLGEGDTIPLARTNRHAELEEVLGALSLVLSGGGIDQIETIARELNNAFSGNEAEIRALLTRVDELVTELDGQKEEIVDAIEATNRLAGTLVDEKRDLTTALDGLSPGFRVVAEQRDEIVGMLESLHTLSDVTVDTISRSRRQMVENLRALEPTLRKLGEAGKELPIALKIVPTYPLPYNGGDTMKGDFANVDVRFKLNLDELIENIQNANEPTPGATPSTGSSPEALPLPEVLAPPRIDLPGLGSTGTGSAGLLGSLLGAGR